MRFRIITTFCLFGTAFGFNIITPGSAEVINVDKYYNLTWTTERLPANSVVNEIIIGFPDPAVLYAAENVWVYNRFNDESINISGTDGYYTMGLAPWWSPFYNDLPHLNGSWSIFLTLSNQAPNGTRLDDLNDIVEVMFTSLSRTHDQRPQLSPMKSFGVVGGSGGSGSQSEVDSALEIWPVILSILLPAVFLLITICLVRFRWKRHAYSTLSTRQSIKSLDLSPSVISARGTEGENPVQQGLKPASFRRLPTEFLFSAFLAIAPLVALLVALISLLLLHKVTPSQRKASNFPINESLSDPAAFYMDYDATRYTTVASWTSSIALLLPGFLTSLAWYRQTQRLESDATLSQYDKLLTPYQLSLLLSLKSGTLGSLWDYVLYIVSRRREKQAKFLFEAGFVVLLSTLLGQDFSARIYSSALTVSRLGLWMADTWLHIETSTVSLTSAFSFTSSQSWVSLEQYGRALIQNCTSGHLSSIGQNYSCLLLPLLSGMPPTLNDSVLYSSVISERNEITTIKSITLGQDRIAYLAPASPRNDIDYRASTFAVRSVCENVDEWCGLPLTNQSLPWLPLLKEPASAMSAHCGKFVGIPANTSDAVHGTTVTQGVVGAVTSFFKDQDWQEVMNVNNTANSFYTVSRLDSILKPSSKSLPAYPTSVEAGVYWSNFIGCNTELINFTYTYVNGSVWSAAITPLDNLDLARAVYQATLYNFDPLFAGGVAMTAMADDIDFAVENWIDTWHRSYLALAAIATTEADNIDQQQRFLRIVARIPKAPLYSLGILLVLSILFNSFILFQSLWKINLGKTYPKQMIISIAGLAANSFDGKVANTRHVVGDKWNLFEESKEDSPSTRIGISENSAGGYDFVAFVAQGDSENDNDQGDLRSREEQGGRKLSRYPVVTTETASSDENNFPTGNR